MARITGTPPKINFGFVGDAKRPPPATFAQIAKDPSIWTGPLGPYYSSGLVEADHVFYATQENNWNYNANDLFKGLEGIAYSTDDGQDWHEVNKGFPAPLGNLSWVIRGRGFYADGYVYAIATEREFNASKIIMGRSLPGVANMTNPSHWHAMARGLAGDQSGPLPEVVELVRRRDPDPLLPLPTVTPRASQSIGSAATVVTCG